MWCRSRLKSQRGHCQPYKFHFFFLQKERFALVAFSRLVFARRETELGTVYSTSGILFDITKGFSLYRECWPGMWPVLIALCKFWVSVKGKMQCLLGAPSGTPCKEYFSSLGGIRVLLLEGKL